MAKKSSALYSSLFGDLKTACLQHGLTFNPGTIMSDFESGLIPAIRLEFPNTQHKGCHFHMCQVNLIVNFNRFTGLEYFIAISMVSFFCLKQNHVLLYFQAIWRKVVSLGLADVYKTNQNCYVQIRQLMALAFAPLVLVRQTFHILSNAADQALAPLFAYFHTEWILNADAPPRMWNVHGQDIRTNNSVEGWHARFKKIVRKRHPNLWELLIELQREQAATEVAVQQITGGQKVNTVKRKYRKIQKQIRKLTRRYRSGNPPLSLTRYIQRVSYLLAKYD
jgi:hypothetical protein